MRSSYIKHRDKCCPTLKIWVVGCYIVKPEFENEFKMCCEGLGFQPQFGEFLCHSRSN